MPSNATRPVLTRMAWFVLATFAGGGCDLQTKAWAEDSLAELPGRAMMVVEPWLEFSLTYNRGTAFSLIPDLGASRLIFGVLALAVLGLLAVLVHRWRSDRGETLALGAIAGGALGNGVDRALREAPGGGTGVVDFIKLNYPWGGSWPIFNIADVLVAVGIGYFVLRGLREATKGEAAPASATG